MALALTRALFLLPALGLALSPIVMVPGLAGSVFKVSSNHPARTLALPRAPISPSSAESESVSSALLQAKLDGAVAPHFWCATHSDWFVTWLNLEELVPEQKVSRECWLNCAARSVYELAFVRNQPLLRICRSGSPLRALPDSGLLIFLICLQRSSYCSRSLGGSPRLVCFMVRPAM